MNSKWLLYVTASIILFGCGDDNGGDEQPSSVNLFMQTGCNSEEDISVYELTAGASTLVGSFATTDPQDISCTSTEGVNLSLRTDDAGETEDVHLVYLSSNLKWYEEIFDPSETGCAKVTNCFGFEFPTAQSGGSANEFILMDKPDIDNMVLEMEISESTINCFGLGLAFYKGDITDFALFELKADSDLKYQLNDSDLQRLRDLLRDTPSPIVYFTLYDIYKSSITTPNFTAILKLAESDQETCRNSNTCLLFRKDNIGKGHPLQSARLYYWYN